MDGPLDRQSQTDLNDGAHVAGGDIAHEVVVRCIPVAVVLGGEWRVFALVQQHEELPALGGSNRSPSGDGRVIALVQQHKELPGRGVK